MRDVIEFENGKDTWDNGSVRKKPMLRVLEQRFDARPHRIEHRRARDAARLTNARRRAAQVALDRVSRNAHFACELANRDVLHQVAVTNDVDRFHDEHPPSERRKSGGGGGSLLARRKGQFCDGGIIRPRRRSGRVDEL
jgi:hypothetical protein